MWRSESFAVVLYGRRGWRGLRAAPTPHARQGKAGWRVWKRPPTKEELEFREVDRDRWGDLERLFESRGGPKYCWCMLWRTMPRSTFRSDPGAKKEALRRRVQEGTAVGILGYLDGEPIGWCSIAPRESYRELGGPADAPGTVWSIACFFVPRKFRGQGMTRRLIEAAVDHAREKGAAVVEAYPVGPDSPSYRFMGLVGSFEAVGFHAVGRAGSRRHVMRLPVRAQEKRAAAEP